MLENFRNPQSINHNEDPNSIAFINDFQFRLAERMFGENVGEDIVLDFLVANGETIREWYKSASGSSRDMARKGLLSDRDYDELRARVKVVETER